MSSSNNNSGSNKRHKSQPNGPESDQIPTLKSNRLTEQNGQADSAKFEPFLGTSSNKSNTAQPPPWMLMIENNETLKKYHKERDKDKKRRLRINAMKMLLKVHPPPLPQSSPHSGSSSDTTTTSSGLSSNSTSSSPIVAPSGGHRKIRRIISDDKDLRLINSQYLSEDDSEASSLFEEDFSLMDQSIPEKIAKDPMLGPSEARDQQLSKHHELQQYILDNFLSENRGEKARKPLESILDNERVILMSKSGGRGTQRLPTPPPPSTLQSKAKSYPHLEGSKHKASAMLSYDPSCQAKVDNLKLLIEELDFAQDRSISLPDLQADLEQISSQLQSSAMKKKKNKNKKLKMMKLSKAVHRTSNSDSIDSSGSSSITDSDKQSHLPQPVCTICLNLDTGYIIHPCRCSSFKPIHFHCLKPNIIARKSLRCLFCHRTYRDIIPVYENLPIRSTAMRVSAVFFMLGFLTEMFLFVFFVAPDYRYYFRSFFQGLFLIATMTIAIFLSLLIGVHYYNKNNRKLVDVYLEPNAICLLV